MPYKLCKKCGEPFEPKNPDQDYCNPRCRRNDHGARRNYFPRFGSDATSRKIYRTYKNVITKVERIIKWQSQKE